MEDEAIELGGQAIFISDDHEPDHYTRGSAVYFSLELAKIAGNANASELVARAKIIFEYLKNGN